jgi:hypothetical protein
MNVMFGLSMSLNAYGRWIQGGYFLCLAIGPALVSSVAGNLATRGFTPRSWAFLFCAILMSVLAVSNTKDFVGEQFLGKLKFDQMKAKSSKDIAEIQNQHTLKERDETRAMLMRKYESSKTDAAREAISKELDRLTSKPIDLNGTPSVDAALTDARASLSEMFGIDQDKLKVYAIPIVLAIVELMCPLWGFKLWPPKEVPEEYGKDRLPNGNRLETVRKLNKDQARAELHIIAFSIPPWDQETFVEHCGCKKGTGSKWLEDFAREGWIRRKICGRRKLILPGPLLLAQQPKSNGHALPHNVTALRPA